MAINHYGSKGARVSAFKAMPETCETLRAILDLAKEEIMLDCGIDPADDAYVDAGISRAFCRIRMEITHPFRKALIDAYEREGGAPCSLRNQNQL